MVKIELKEIVSNHDNRRKALNAVERGNKKTNPQYPYYGANGIVDFIDEYIFDEELLCIAEDGGNWGYKQNCSYIVNGKYWVNNHVHVLKPKKNVEIKYLMYYLNYTDLTSYITGTTRGKLTRTALDKIQINLPELEIQREIVIILDKINNLIEKNKKRIIYLEELVKSRFIEMFGDPIKNDKGWEKEKLLENVVEKVENISKNSEIIIISYIDISSINNLKNRIETYKNYYIDEAPSRAKKIINRNDILMSTVRPNLKNIALFDIETENKAIASTGFCILRTKTKLNTLYLFNVLLSNSFTNELSKKEIGANYPAVTENDIKNISIALPPLTLQNEFAEFVTKTYKLKFEAEKSLKEMENLYESLMQKFFKQN